MNQNTHAQQLHDKATRGIVLSEAEQAQLDLWYAQNDQTESKLLTQVSPTQSAAELQTQINTGLTQLQTVTQQIKTLSAENESLQREIVALHQELTQQASSQSV